MLMGFKKAGLFTLILLLIGLIFVVLLTKNSTQTRQDASGTTNINTGSKVTDTKNPDNSMGPSKSSGNYSNSLKKENLGSLTFSVSNTNKATIKNLIIKVKKTEVFLGASDKNVNKWETLDMQLPISIDLAQLSGGGLVNLSFTNLSFGKYKEVRLYIENAVLVLENGKTEKLTIERKDSVVRVTRDFTIEKNKNTNIVLDLDAQKSFSILNGKYFLKPFVSDILINK